MSTAAFTMALRLRGIGTSLTALGMASVIVMVGALFPAVGHTIGELDVPEGVAELLGGADYGTIGGWMRSEIGAVYGPLVIGATAITSAGGSTAGEEEDGILGLILSYPIGRSNLVLAKAGAMAVGVSIVALGTLIGLIAGVVVAGGGVGVGNLVALALHLAVFGFALGALALALAAATGRKAVASGGAAGFALLGFLINGFAPLVDGAEWLKYLSPFYYYAGSDPIAHGVDLGDLAILAAVSLVLIAGALVGMTRRDLRA
jgi:ABC-2 type transport system permease protein